MRKNYTRIVTCKISLDEPCNYMDENYFTFKPRNKKDSNITAQSTFFTRH